jgi:hypothetical protein
MHWSPVLLTRHSANVYQSAQLLLSELGNSNAYPASPSFGMLTRPAPKPNLEAFYSSDLHSTLERPISRG